MFHSIKLNIAQMWAETMISNIPDYLAFYEISTRFMYVFLSY